MVHLHKAQVLLTFDYVIFLYSWEMADLIQRRMKYLPLIVWK